MHIIIAMITPIMLLKVSLSCSQISAFEEMPSTLDDCGSTVGSIVGVNCIELVISCGTSIHWLPALRFQVHCDNDKSLRIQAITLVMSLVDCNETKYIENKETIKLQYWIDVFHHNMS